VALPGEAGRAARNLIVKAPTSKHTAAIPGMRYGLLRGAGFSGFSEVIM